MLTKQTFLDAADLLEKEGKVEETYVSQQTGCGLCAVGALAKADGVKVVLNHSGNFGFEDISDWLYDTNKQPISEETVRFIRPEYVQQRDALGLRPNLDDLYSWSDSVTAQVVINAFRAFGRS